MIGFMMGSASWPLKVISTTTRPLSMVDESSTAMIPIFNGGRPLPWRTRFTGLMDRKYDRTFEEGKSAMSTNSRTFALTADVWTNVATKAGLRVTRHASHLTGTCSQPLRHSRTDTLHWSPKWFHRHRARQCYLCSMRHSSAGKSSEEAASLVEHSENSELAKSREARRETLPNVPRAGSRGETALWCPAPPPGVGLCALSRVLACQSASNS